MFGGHKAAIFTQVGQFYFGRWVSFSSAVTTADIIDVQTVNPVILNTQELGLGEGVNKLIDVMGLLTIADQVPVSFGAEFHRKP